MSYHSPQTTSRRRKTHVGQFLTQLDIRITSGIFKIRSQKINNEKLRNMTTNPPTWEGFTQKNSELHSQQTTRLRNQTLCLRNLFFPPKKISPQGLFQPFEHPELPQPRQVPASQSDPKTPKKKQKRWGIFSNPHGNVSQRANFLVAWRSRIFRLRFFLNFFFSEKKRTGTRRAPYFGHGGEDFLLTSPVDLCFGRLKKPLYRNKFHL